MPHFLDWRFQPLTLSPWPLFIPFLECAQDPDGWMCNFGWRFMRLPGAYSSGNVEHKIRDQELENRDP
jgi:hypothetical protein